MNLYLNINLVFAYCIEFIMLEQFLDAYLIYFFTIRETKQLTYEY